MACKKVKYKSTNRAWAVINVLVKNNKANKGDLSIYKCRRCGFFHIGHKRNRERIKPATWDKIKNETKSTS